MMDADGLERLRPFDAIYFGAVGDPSVPDDVAVWELILPIRKRFDQYVNLRPMRLLPGVAGPLAGRTPGRPRHGVRARELRRRIFGARTALRVRARRRREPRRRRCSPAAAIERIARYAFALAARRPRRLLASATKSNALRHSMVLWDDVVAEVAREYPQVTVRKYHVDALAARMVTHPETLDVIVGSNLFGDILTDLGAALTGSLGLAPGANLDPERRCPSMFEPIHGSAPDIAGRGIANPIAAIWAGALMLDHLGEKEAHDRIVGAIERVLASGSPRTPDLGGSATTDEVARAIREAV